MTEQYSASYITDETQLVLFHVEPDQSHYTGEDAYIDYVKHIEGPDAMPRIPYLDLSDMAIQYYEIEVDMVNAYRCGARPHDGGDL